MTNKYGIKTLVKGTEPVNREEPKDHEIKIVVKDEEDPELKMLKQSNPKYQENLGKKK